ncbi:MAG TPA: flagellar filament capping protein FliD [Oleiagrimonas sp.]|nr:flagellar filament capping protein FliD [Oleiagrimonas sp.]
MSSITALGVGSGLDLNGLLSKLREGEEKRLVPIARQKKSYESKISALGTLKSALSKLQDAAQKLGDAGAFQAVASSVTGEALQATTSNTTPPGDYHIHVTQRARASSVATLGLTDKTSNQGSGTIAFTLANGKTMSVTVDADNSSLEDIRDAINAKNSSVRASLINDGTGTPYRLVFRARDSGSKAAVSNIQVSGDLGSSLQLDASTRQTGRNAQLTINGIAIESAGNRVEGAIQGVTLNLVKSGDVTLQVTRDVEASKAAVTDFVNAYNNLVSTVDDLTGYDASSRSAGVLLGSSTVRNVESRLRRVMGGAIDNGGTYSVLSDMGISLQLDGTLKIDDDKLDDAVNGDMAALRQYFAGGAGGDGLADKLDSMLGKMTSEQGVIESATDGFNQSIENVKETYDRTQQSIDAKIARYRSEFSKLDGLIARMNSTSSYLSRQFEAMSNMKVGS